MVQRRDAGGSIVTPVQQCTAERAKGGWCRGMARRGQYCWTHLKQQDGLRVKQSSLGKKAGMGLFADKAFKVGDTITLYTGDWLEREEDGGPYVLQLTHGRAVDAARRNAAPGRWANDPRGSGRRPTHVSRTTRGGGGRC